MPFVDVEAIDPKVYTQLITSMPTESMISRPYLKLEYPEGYMRTFLDAGLRMNGRMIGQWGAVQQVVKAFEDLSHEIPFANMAKITELWISGKDLGELWDESLEALDNALRDLSVYEEIPLIGMFIAVGRYLYNIINWSVSAVGDVMHQVEGLALRYDQDADQRLCNEALHFLSESQDYTKLFLPPYSILLPTSPSKRDTGIEHINVDPRKGGAPHQVVVVPNGVKLGFGFHPGTSFLPRAWMYYTGDATKGKTRKKWTYTKGYKLAEKGEVYGFEQFYPALQMTSLLLWQRILKNSPELFRVDAHQIRGSWEGYFRVLEMYLTLKPDDLGAYNTPEFIRPMTMGVFRYLLDAPQWGCAGSPGNWSLNGVTIPSTYYTNPQEWMAPGINEIPAPRQWKYGDPGPRLTASGVTRFIVDTQLRARQMNALNTLTCAYVPSDAPALRNDPQMFQRWEQRRGQLLQHPARVQVDLDLVPPGQWRNALVQSLKDVPAGQKFMPFGAGLSSTEVQPEVGAWPGLPRIPKTKKAIFQPPKKKKEAEEGMTGGQKALTGAAAVGVAYLGWRLARKKKLLPFGKK